MNTEFVAAYIGAIEWLVLLLIPAMAILTAYAWRLAFRYWPYKLPLIKAITCTIVGGAVTWIGFTTVWRWRVGPTPIEFIPITATVVLALCVVPFLTVGYLVWLDLGKRGGTRNRRASDNERHVSR